MTLYKYSNVITCGLFLLSYLLLQSAFIGFSDFNDGTQIEMKCKAPTEVNAKVQLGLGKLTGNEVNADTTTITVASLGLTKFGVVEELTEVTPPLNSAAICSGSDDTEAKTVVNLPREFKWTCDEDTSTGTNLMVRTSKYGEDQVVAGNSMTNLITIIANGENNAVRAVSNTGDVVTVDGNMKVCNGQERRLQVKRSTGKVVLLTYVKSSGERDDVDVNHKVLYQPKAIATGTSASTTPMSCLRHLEDDDTDKWVLSLSVFATLTLILELVRTREMYDADKERPSKYADAHYGIIEILLHLATFVVAAVVLANMVDLKDGGDSPCFSGHEHSRLFDHVAAGISLWFIAFVTQVAFIFKALCVDKDTLQGKLVQMGKYSRLPVFEEEWVKHLKTGGICIPRFIVSLILLITSFNVVGNGLSYKAVCDSASVQPIYVAVMLISALALGCTIVHKKARGRAHPSRWVLLTLLALAWAQFSIEHEVTLAGGPFETCHSMDNFGAVAPQVVLVVGLLWLVWEGMMTVLTVYAGENENSTSNIVEFAKSAKPGDNGKASGVLGNILSNDNKPSRGIDVNSRLTKDAPTHSSLQFV